MEEATLEDLFMDSKLRYLFVLPAENAKAHDVEK